MILTGASHCFDMLKLLIPPLAENRFSEYPLNFVGISLAYKDSNTHMSTYSGMD
jgi:hypothetical protein